MAQLSATLDQQLAYTEQAALSVLSTDDARSLFNDNRVPLTHWARKDGEVTTVLLHITRGLDFDSVDDNGLTLLHFAAAMGHSKAVQDLVRSGSPKSVVAGQFATPLHQAASNGHVHTVIAMLEEGCPLNVVDGDGRTVLHWAAQAGHTKVVRELVDRGCDKNARQANGCTPLFTAAHFGRTDVVRELAQLGATKSVVAGDFGTPLHQATANAHMETVMALLKDDELCEHSGELTNNETTLSEEKQMVSRYIGVCNAVGETSVMWALRFGHVEVFKLLISEGGAISDRDTNIYSLTGFEQCFVGGQASKLSEFCAAGGIRGCGEGLKGVLARLIASGLVDAHKVLCLCAISGDSVFLDEQYSELVASNACPMPAAVECTKYYFDKGVPFIDQLNMADENTLNPLQMSILSMKCFKMGFAIKSVEFGTKDHMEFIRKLLYHPVLKKLVHDNLPNGLSPLDLAQQFELSDAAALIQAAGGRPGAWRNIPPDIVMGHPQALLKLKEAFASIKAIAEYGKCGHEFVKNVFSEILGDDRNSIKEWVLSQPPDLEHVVKHVLPRIQMRHWKRLGISLGMEKLVVDDLGQRYSDDNDCCLETLSYWIEHGRSVTWRTLLDALGRIETWQTVNELTDNIVTVLGVCHQEPCFSRSTEDIEQICSKQTAELSRPPAKQRRTSDAEGVLCPRKHSLQVLVDMHDHPPVVTALKCALTGSQGTVPLMIVTSSWPTMNERAAGAKRSPPVCEDSLPQSKPTLREVCDHIVCRVAANWYHFGLTLRVEDYLLENIKATERGNVQACCTDMLRRWLRGEQATGELVRSWPSLLQAVQRCIGWEAAQSIAESLQAAQ